MRLKFPSRSYGFRLLCLCVCALFTAACAPAAPPPPHAEETRVALYTVAALSADGTDAARAVEESFQTLRRLESLFDANRPESDVARLNAAAGTAPVAIAEETWRVLNASQKISAATDGAWDITVAPLSALWRDAIAARRVPEADEIDRARQSVGWKKLRLDPKTRTAYLEERGMAVDLGGAAKGLALDELRAVYEKHRVTGLINLGGSSIAAVGEKTPGRPFRVALRHPRETPPAALGVLPFADAELASSGDYERFFEDGARRWHHIVDPRTGYPANPSATGVALLIKNDRPDTGLLSDILSTALFILGPEQGLALLSSEAPFAEAAFLGETALSARTPRFPSLENAR